MVVFVFNAGDQLPVIPSSDTVGKAERGVPAHIEATGLNVGVVLGLTTIVNVTVGAHEAKGVKV